jgi:hypothetical protein
MPWLLKKKTMNKRTVGFVLVSIPFLSLAVLFVTLWGWLPTLFIFLVPIGFATGMDLLNN